MATHQSSLVVQTEEQTGQASKNNKPEKQQLKYSSSLAASFHPPASSQRSCILVLKGVMATTHAKLSILKMIHNVLAGEVATKA